MQLKKELKKPKNKTKKSWLFDIPVNWQLYVMLLLPIAYIVIFKYVPMAGIIIAFKDYSIKKGIFGSDFVGLKHFINFIKTPNFILLIRNTLSISLLSLIMGFPAPIILALLLNECGSKAYKKTVQMITYAPYFISTVVMCGLILNFLSLRTGLVNNVIKLFGGSGINFMGVVSWFRIIYVSSGIWKGMGYGAILYIATLASVDQVVVEASIIDGASRLRRVWHIDLPTITPVIVIQLILNIGAIMSLGFEKVYLLQNPVNMEVSETIQTFVYKRGLTQFQYSYASAVGLFNSLVNFALIIAANKIANKIGNTSLW